MDFPLPGGGEGWGEGVRTYRESRAPSPHPSPQRGEGAGRCARRPLCPHTATILGPSHATCRATDQDFRQLHRPDRGRHPRCELRARARHLLHDAGAVRLRQDHDACAASPASKRRTRHDLGRRPRTLFDRREEVNVPVEQRAVGMVFQSYAIWPHMTVAENVAFPLTVLKTPALHAHRDRGRRSRGPWRWSISPASRTGRRPRLSGGQQQRVALGARHRARAAASPARRAALQSRCPVARRDAQRAQATAEQDRHHHRLRHARPVGGAGALRPDRRDRSRHDPAVRLAARTSTSGRPIRSSRASSAPPTCLPAGWSAQRTGGATWRCSAIVPSSVSFRAPSPIRHPSRCRSGRKASAWCRATGGPKTTGDNCIPGRIAAVTFLGATRRVDVTSGGVTLQVTAAADHPLPADGEVDLLFAPERTVALPGKVS